MKFYTIAFLFFSMHVAAQRLDSKQITVNEGTNMAMALSPDGQTIAIDLQGTIYTLPAKGGVAKSLTDGMGDDRQPCWSTDGQRVAFQSYRGGTYHIWSVNKDGKELKQHTSGPYDHREPFWAPDGKSIVCSSDRKGNYDIWKIDLSTGTATALTTHLEHDYTPAYSPDGKTLAFASSRANGAGIYLLLEDGTEKLLAPAGKGTPSAPAWSRDGKWISYQLLTVAETSLLSVEVATGKIVPLSKTGDDVFPFRAAWAANGSILYTTDGKIKRRGDEDGGSVEVPFQVTMTVSTPVYQRKIYDFDGPSLKTVKGIRSPVVSPDGKQVAFIALGDVWLLTIGLPKPVKLTDDVYYETDLAWSPDGAKLLFSADRTGNMDLYTLELSTRKVTQLTQTSDDEFQGSWLADGKKIAFMKQGLRNTLAVGTVLQIMDLTTNVTKAVYKPMFQPGQPSWSPNGKYVLLAALEAYSSKFREGISKFLLVNSESGQAVSFDTPIPYQTPAMRYRNGPTWSPDGTKLAYVKDALLWVIDVNEDGQFKGQPRAVTSELAEAPTWTGDSKSLVYVATDHLRKVALADTSKQDIPFDLTWTNAKPKGTVVIHAGRLFDGKNEKLLTNVDLVVEDSRIKAIQPHRTNYPANYRKVDASNLTVMPGLFETHSHLDAQFGEKTGRIWLAYGITTVREPGSDPYDAVEQREAWHSGKRPGPFHFLTGALTDGGRIYYNMATAIGSEAQLKLELNRANRLGYDLIKTYVRMPDEWQQKITEYAHQNGMTVSSHEIFPAARYGVDAVEHLGATSRRGYSPKLTSTAHSYDDVVQIISQSKMVITPTLALSGGYWSTITKDTSLFDTPQFRQLYPAYYRAGMLETAQQMKSQPSAIVLNYANSGKVAKRLLDSGARITSGTDSPIMPYGTSLHVELWSYVESGFTPFQALQTSMINAAKSLNVDKDLGTLEVGKIANISIVEGNPLQNIHDAQRVRYVLVNGKVYTLEELLKRP
ncbi:amidohydrolase family protein [Runella salmonicolor]|uniref:Amidohydrolase family protein n=1 Tax=Runella salmonicolor TaxID=2950278 RepID=A0ABT1FQ75_9BACT|nr:amidohydrolase family protein [Runella salmonicolor]MCP1383926.1 amidohydrolase family protein [Runella salmonicolor]